jgi:hypothetical protein
MKKFLMFICAVMLVFGMASSAMATLFTLDSYTVNFRDKDPGLELYVIDILPEPTNADLTAGNSYAFDLFRVGTTEHYVNRDDRKAYDFSVNFAFSNPDDLNEVVSGQSDGHWRLLRDDYGSVEWDGPATFTFGDGGLFTIALSDVYFGTPGSAVVGAKLNFASDAAPAPPPPPPNLPPSC